MIPVNRSSDPAVEPVRSQLLIDANARLLALRQQVARSKTETPSPTNTTIPAFSTHSGKERAVLSCLVGKEGSSETDATPQSKRANPPTPQTVSHPVLINKRKVSEQIGTSLLDQMPCDLHPIGSSSISPALAAANLRLFDLRQQAAQARAETPPPADPTPQSNTTAPTIPAHLGWGSAALSRVIHAIIREEEADPTPPPEPTHTLAPQADADPQIVSEAETPSTPLAEQILRVHPALLTAILNHEQVAVGRIWLLARHLDRQGRGWLSIDDLRQHLTDKNAPLRVCGWRRLRQLLKEGEGVFWQRDAHHRLWLRSTVKLTLALDLERLAGTPVALPLTDLLQSIGHVRAAFYASFHAGRNHQPISRQTLTDMTGVPERTQRAYDTRLHIDRVSNFSLTPITTDEKESYWKNGRALFKFEDKLGRQGPAGQTYWGQRLPNSYHAPYLQLDHNGTKSVNRQLKHDLAKNGTQGNEFEKYPQLFHNDGKKAGRAYQSGSDVFFQTSKGTDQQFWSAWLFE